MSAQLLEKKALYELNEAKAIADNAKRTGRNMTADERETIKNHQDEAQRLTLEMQRLPLERKVPQSQPGSYGNGSLVGDGGKFVDLATGREVRHWSKGQPMAVDQHREGEELSLGRYIRSLITDRRDFLNDAEQRTMSEGINSLGGNVVPNPFSTQLIDRARNLSVIMRAGAQIVEMDSQTLDMARLTADATYQTKTENAAFTGTDLLFGRITFNAKTIGCLVTSSMELAQDAPNFEQLVEGALATGLAVELDRLALRGTGTSEPLGASNLPGAQESTGVGSLDYDTLLDMREDLVDVNTPDDGIAFATTALLGTVLNKLKSGDGSTSAANYYNPATIPGLENVQRFVTNQAVAGEGYMWHGPAILWGVRLMPTVEISRDAGFENYQVKIRIIFRGDFNMSHANQFVTYRGLTA